MTSHAGPVTRKALTVPAATSLPAVRPGAEIQTAGTAACNRELNFRPVGRMPVSSRSPAQAEGDPDLLAESNSYHVPVQIDEQEHLSHFRASLASWHPTESVLYIGTSSPDWPRHHRASCMRASCIVFKGCQQIVTFS